MGIKDRRMALGLTRKELADRIGLATETVARYERNERELRSSTIYKLAEALDCDPMVLLDEIEGRRHKSLSGPNLYKLLSNISWLENWLPQIHNRIDEVNEVKNLFDDLSDPSNYEPETIELAEMLEQGREKVAEFAAMLAHVRTKNRKAA